MPKLADIKLFLITLSVYLLLKEGKDHVHHAHVKDVISDLAELAEYSVLVAVGGIIFGEHLNAALRDNSPKLQVFFEKTIFPRFEGYSKLVGDALTGAIERKQFLI